MFHLLVSTDFSVQMLLFESANANFLVGYRLVNPKAFAVIEQWKKMQSTNIIPLIEVFTTKAFGDNCELQKIHFLKVH